MALKIIAPTDPILIETAVVTLYGPPGSGKTSLGFATHSPLLLDCDNGAYRSAFRKDCVRPTDWKGIEGISKEDVEGYRTLIMDTTGRALDLLGQDIIAENAKMGRGGSLTLQGYGVLKTRFSDYLKLMRSFGLDIVLIAHSDEKQSGDDLIERLDMAGSSKQEVYKSSDAMARLGYRDGKRVLSFSPTETQFGKDPAGLGRVEVPNLAKEPLFLGELIDQIKAHINAGTAEMAAMAKRREAWDERLAAVTKAADFTALIQEGWDGRSKRALLDAATARGFAFDEGTQTFKKAGGAKQPADGEAEPTDEQLGLTTS